MVLVPVQTALIAAAEGRFVIITTSGMPGMKLVMKPAAVLASLDGLRAAAEAALGESPVKQSSAKYDLWLLRCQSP